MSTYALESGIFRCLLSAKLTKKIDYKKVSRKHSILASISLIFHKYMKSGEIFKINEETSLFYHQKSDQS